MSPHFAPGPHNSGSDLKTEKVKQQLIVRCCWDWKCIYYSTSLVRARTQGGRQGKWKDHFTAKRWRYEWLYHLPTVGLWANHLTFLKVLIYKMGTVISPPKCEGYFNKLLNVLSTTLLYLADKNTGHLVKCEFSINSECFFSILQGTRDIYLAVLRGTMPDAEKEAPRKGRSCRNGCTYGGKVQQGAHGGDRGSEMAGLWGTHPSYD